jgi:hypothetical protein
LAQASSRSHVKAGARQLPLVVEEPLAVGGLSKNHLAVGGLSVSKSSGGCRNRNPVSPRAAAACIIPGGVPAGRENAWPGKTGDDNGSCGQVSRLFEPVNPGGPG